MTRGHVLREILASGRKAQSTRSAGQCIQPSPKVYLKLYLNKDVRGDRLRALQAEPARLSLYPPRRREEDLPIATHSGYRTSKSSKSFALKPDILLSRQIVFLALPGNLYYNALHALPSACYMSGSIFQADEVACIEADVHQQTSIAAYSKRTVMQ